uniref:Reverse transcriptase domain-containing protein n=1 Tax=Meloidogyne hapla TaxID=6305 RepID=A0A1I8BIG7_MELHA
MIYPPPKSILYCYGQFNSLVPELQRIGVSAYSGVPPEEIIMKQEKPSLLILDDLLYSIDEKNRVQLTKRQKCRLVPYADFVRSVSRVRTERGARRMVIQKGNGLPLGFFPALLTPIIIEISKNIASHFSQNKNGQ